MDQALDDLIGPAVGALGYELWGIERAVSGRRTLLRIYIDSPDGISVEDCARVSGSITGVLEVEDPIAGPYDLEISSPGLDRRIFTLEQFRRYTGHTVRVRLRSPMHGKRKISGIIKEIDSEAVVLMDTGAEYRLALRDMDHARLVPSFD